MFDQGQALASCVFRPHSRCRMNLLTPREEKQRGLTSVRQTSHFFPLWNFPVQKEESRDESRPVGLRIKKGQIFLEKRREAISRKFMKGGCWVQGWRELRENGMDVILDKIKTHRRTPLPKPLAGCRRRRSPSLRRR